MAKRPPVLCRECRERFSRDDLVEGVDWVMPSRNFFFHKECYDKWLKKREDAKNLKTKKKDEEYREEIFHYLSCVLKVPFDGGLVGTQIANMKRRGRTLKGILFALFYHYDIKGNKWNPEYEGIWIAELVYDESARYWCERVKKQENILDEVEKQVMALKTAQTAKVQKKTTRKKWKSKMPEVLDADTE